MLCAVVADAGRADGQAKEPQTNSITPRNGSSLEQAVNALQHHGSILVINSPMTLNSSLVIPADTTVRCVAGGGVYISATHDLTIQGRIVAPARTIFSGEGTVTFAGNRSKDPLLPEW